MPLSLAARKEDLRMMRFGIMGGVALLLVGAWVGDVWAQRGSTSTGVFGSRSVGGSINSQGGSAFGSGQGRGALEGTSAGSRIDQLVGSAGEGSGLDGSERFVRGNRQAGQFVGNGTQDAFVGALTGAALNGFNTGIGQRIAPQRDGRDLNDNSQRRVNVRTQLSIGFRYSRPQPSIIEAKNRKLLNSSALGRLGQIEMTLEDQTARLTGTVASEADRELAARLVRLSPGVSQVENLLEVDDSATDGVSPSDQRR